MNVESHEKLIILVSKIIRSNLTILTWIRVLNQNIKSITQNCKSPGVI